MNVITGTVTANAVLFGSADATDALRRSLRDHGVVGSVIGAAAHLSGDLHNAADRQVAAATAGLLDIDVFDLLAAGWRKHAALVAAGRRTLAAPGSSELVELATHQVQARQRPYIDVYLDGVAVGRIHLDLQLQFTVASLVAVVRDGRLVALASGHCTVDATLSIQGIEAARRSAEFDLPLVVRLGAGVPLTPGVASVPGQRAAPTPVPVAATDPPPAAAVDHGPAGAPPMS